MKKGYLLVVAIAIIAICCVFIFTACGDPEVQIKEVEVLVNQAHNLSVSMESFIYNGEAAQPTISAGNETCTIEYYALAEDGTETKLESAPKDAGRYKVKASIPETDCAASAVFTISQAEASIEGLSNIDKFYDGAEATPTYTINSDSQDITVSYRKTSESTWTNKAPTESGEYEVLVEVAGSKNYKATSKRAVITITPVPSLLEIDRYIGNSWLASIGLLVAHDNTIVAVGPQSELAIVVMQELDVEDLIGKSVTYASEAVVQAFNDANGLVDATSIEVLAQEQTVLNESETAVKLKLYSMHNTSLNIYAHEINDYTLRAVADVYLAEFNEAELDAMSKDEMQARIAKVVLNLENTHTSSNFYLFCSMRAKFMAQEKLRSIKEQIKDIPEAQSFLSSIDDLIAEYDDSLATDLSAFLENTSTPYSNITGSILALNEAYKSKAIATTSQDSLKAAIAISNAREAIETCGDYALSLAMALNDKIDIINASASELLANIKTAGINFTIDDETIEETAIQAVYEQYEKYFNYNYWTFEEAFAEGTIEYYGFSTSLNKTITINKVNINGVDSDVYYIYDGVIAKTNLANVSPVWGRKATINSETKDVTINNGITGDSNVFVVDKAGNIALRAVEGTPQYLNHIANILDEDKASPYTYIMTEDTGINRIYFYEDSANNVGWATYTNYTPNFVGTWRRVGNDFYTVAYGAGWYEYLIITSSNDGMKIKSSSGLNVKFDGHVVDDQYVQYATVIFCIEANDEYVAYLASDEVFHVDGSGYSLFDKGSWCFNDAGDKIIAIIGDYRYEFDWYENDTIDSVSFVEGGREWIN